MFHFFKRLAVICVKKYLNNIGIRVSLITILINFLLFIFKLIVGILSSSNAMVSDAVHSLSDVITTVVVIIGLVLSNKDADLKHPYGHERMESVFAVILSFLLLLTGVGIGYLGIKNIIEGTKGNLIAPGIFALVAAVVSIIVKEIMYRYTMNVAKKIKSTSMEADAWHHRSDTLSSIGAFIGIFGARIGFPIFDPICSILICIFIIKAAVEIFMEAISQMIDTSCDEETTKLIVDIIYNADDSIKINDLKTRMFGSRIYIDVEIAIDGDLAVKDANKVVESIHDTIEDKMDSIKHCNIHVVPKNDIIDFEL